MKLSKATKEVLENFATLQNSMLFQKGVKQRTNTFSKALLADVELEEDMPQQFGIYDMQQFLSVMSIFKEPTIDLEDKHLVLSEGKQKVVYRYCNPDLIGRNIISMDRKLDLPSVEISFDLTKEQFTKSLDATRILGLSHVAIYGDGDVISLRSVNPRDDNYSFANFEVGESDKKFNMLISVDHLKILQHNYKVNISKSMLAKFISQEMKLVYTLALEKESKYEG